MLKYTVNHHAVKDQHRSLKSHLRTLIMICHDEARCTSAISVAIAHSAVDSLHTHAGGKAAFSISLSLYSISRPP